MTKLIHIKGSSFDTLTIGDGNSLTIMAGPCVIESRDLCMQIAQDLKELTDKLGIQYVFKASFDKANRTSCESFRGPGLDDGLRILEEIKSEFSVPVVSDIHLPQQAKAAGEVLDIIQIPAFLCRQTDLLTQAAKTGKCIQVKKAQFLSPGDMKNVIGKLNENGNDNIMLVERGSCFGYNQLICDMTSIPKMKALGYPVVMDATHSTQQPGALGNSSGGNPAMAPILARSAIAAGADGLFIETHPDPNNALCDAACMINLSDMEKMLIACRDIYALVSSID